MADLTLRRLVTILRDAERVVLQASIRNEFQPIAYRQIIQELLTNPYTDDIPRAGDYDSDRAG
jgi:hypothetical protein